jgi:hypothetical protein
VVEAACLQPEASAGLVSGLAAACLQVLRIVTIDCLAWVRATSGYFSETHFSYFFKNSSHSGMPISATAVDAVDSVSSFLPLVHARRAAPRMTTATARSRRLPIRGRSLNR